jgi:hypothetical protein
MERASIASMLIRPFFKLPCAFGCGVQAHAFCLWSAMSRLSFGPSLFQRIHQIDDVAFLFLIRR